MGSGQWGKWDLSVLPKFTTCVAWYIWPCADFKLRTLCTVIELSTTEPQCLSQCNVLQGLQISEKYVIIIVMKDTTYVRSICRSCNVSEHLLVGIKIVIPILQSMTFIHTIVWLPLTIEELFDFQHVRSLPYKSICLRICAWGWHITIAQSHLHILQQVHKPRQWLVGFKPKRYSLIKGNLTIRL